MVQMTANTKKLKAKPSLKPGVATVLIGFKGPEDLKLQVEKVAGKLGLTYSEVLRVMTEDFVNKSKALFE